MPARSHRLHPTPCSTRRGPIRSRADVESQLRRSARHTTSGSSWPPSNGSQVTARRRPRAKSRSSSPAANASSASRGHARRARAGRRASARGCQSAIAIRVEDSRASAAGARAVVEHVIHREHAALREPDEHDRRASVDERREQRARLGAAGRIHRGQLHRPPGEPPHARLGVDRPPRAAARLGSERRIGEHEVRRHAERVRERREIRGLHLAAVQHDDGELGLLVTDGECLQTADSRRFSLMRCARSRRR